MLLGGTLLLIRAADQLIEGAKTVAVRAGLSPLIIGMVIVGLGTSMPEFFVNVLSALEGDTALAFGNIIGSNVANLGLVIGLTGILVGTVSIEKSLISTEIPILIGSVFLLTLLFADFSPWDDFCTAHPAGMLSLRDGLVLLLGLVFYLLYLAHGIVRGAENPKVDAIYESDVDSIGVTSKTGTESRFLILWAGVRIAGGVVGLYLGGDFIVEGAVSLARQWGAGMTAIGVIVGIGTSLPELASAVSCAVKKEVDLVVGNVVGSNIFNVLFILGVTSLLQPVSITAGEFLHLLFLAGVTLLFALFLGSRLRLNRWEALLLFLSGIGYLIYNVLP